MYYESKQSGSSDINVMLNYDPHACVTTIRSKPVINNYF